MQNLPIQISTQVSPSSSSYMNQFVFSKIVITRWIRYCSNVYPKAEAYQLCNWCLNKDEKSQNSSNSSSSNSGDLKTKRKTHTLKHSLPIKKQLSPPPKRLVTRSDASKPVFRNKVRRYKLLDEVSS